MSTTHPQQRARWLIPGAFFCVYFFWGSTFVAIRYAVHFLTPAFVSGFRYLAAGLVLLAWFRLRGKQVRITQHEFLRALVLGLLLLTGNNVLLGWAEQYVTAGYAALLTASVPMLIAIGESALPRGKPLSLVGWLGTALGIIGLLVLLAPALRNGLVNHGTATSADHALTLGTSILIVGILSWVAGSLLSGRISSSIDPLLASAWQMTIAGSVNILLGSALGGWHTAQWTPGIFAALAWLTVFGSLIGYSAYTYLLHHVAVAKVATYAYVNPIVAVLLGAVFLGESLHGSQWIAMAIILVAVAIVTASRSAKLNPIPADADEA